MSLKITLVSTFCSYGGAAIAASRLYDALIKQGFDVRKLCLIDQKKKVKLGLIGKVNFWFRFTIERLVIWFSLKDKRNLYRFSIGHGSMSLVDHPLVVDAEIVHLHWINFGFVSTKEIGRLSKIKPVMWTMHDFWPITGGCHLPIDCTLFEHDCRDCFYTSASSVISPKRLLKKKQDAWHGGNIRFVGVSKWLSEHIKRSSLGGSRPVLTIGNSLDTDFFKPMDNHKKSEKLRIIFGAVSASDEIKGASFMVEAMNELDKLVEFELAIFGEIETTILNELDCSIIQLGTLNSEDLVSEYNKSHIYLLTSIQETLSYTTMEAMACGVPVVAFSCGGVSDLVIHKETGYLASNKDTHDLVQGLLYLIDNENNTYAGQEAREHIVNNYSEEQIAKKYAKAFEELIEDD